MDIGFEVECTAVTIYSLFIFAKVCKFVFRVEEELNTVNMPEQVGLMVIAGCIQRIIIWRSNPGGKHMRVLQKSTGNFDEILIGILRPVDILAFFLNVIVKHAGIADGIVKVGIRCFYKDIQLGIILGVQPPDRPASVSERVVGVDILMKREFLSQAECLIGAVLLCIKINNSFKIIDDACICTIACADCERQNSEQHQHGEKQSYCSFHIEFLRDRIIIPAPSVYRKNGKNAILFPDFFRIFLFGIG